MHFKRGCYCVRWLLQTKNLKVTISFLKEKMTSLKKKSLLGLESELGIHLRFSSPQAEHAPGLQQGWLALGRAARYRRLGRGCTELEPTGASRLALHTSCLSASLFFCVCFLAYQRPISRPFRCPGCRPRPPRPPPPPPPPPPGPRLPPPPPPPGPEPRGPASRLQLWW